MTELDPDVGRNFLAHIDADWSRIIALADPWQQPERLADSPYKYLLRAIAHQHVHARAAASLLARLGGFFGDLPSPQQVLASTPADLRSLGFSTAKSHALFDLADHAQRGMIPSNTEALAMSDDSLRQVLTTVRGIGPWTVDMLLIFHLGRQDVLPTGDFGVREGFRRLKKHAKQPKHTELAALGQAWSPYRTQATWYLWQAARLLPVPETQP